MAEVEWFKNTDTGDVFALNPDTPAHTRVTGSKLYEPTDAPEPAAPAASEQTDERPNKSASKKEWVAYAVSQGADEAVAESKTRDELAEVEDFSTLVETDEVTDA